MKKRILYSFLIVCFFGLTLNIISKSVPVLDEEEQDIVYSGGGSAS
ncbi:MAG: hypothetical protein P4L22_04065 [Candidatus Babeliales bacterium]|nr:hypothetical protein [Candidatus Babeliales bacterium]